MTCATPRCAGPAPEGLAFCDACWGALDTRHRHQVRIARKAALRRLSSRTLLAYENTVAEAASTLPVVTG